VKSDFDDVVGPVLTVDVGDGLEDISSFTLGEFELKIKADQEDLNLFSGTDVSNAANELSGLISSQLASLPDNDRSFEISWSSGGGKGKGKGDVILEGRVIGVQVTAVPEPRPYALLALVFFG